MDAYVFQAALLCKDCAEAAKQRLRSSDASSSGDSGDYPQGPYSEGGGEADSPQHCDSCGKFLKNPLTTDGADYVREAIAERPYKEGRRSTRIPRAVAIEVWKPFYDYL